VYTKTGTKDKMLCILI